MLTKSQRTNFLRLLSRSKGDLLRFASSMVVRLLLRTTQIAWGALGRAGSVGQPAISNFELFSVRT